MTTNKKWQGSGCIAFSYPFILSREIQNSSFASIAGLSFWAIAKTGDHIRTGVAQLSDTIFLAMKLMSALRDRGSDPMEWRSHLAKELENLIGSQVTMIVELSGICQGTPRYISSVEYGWDNGFDQESWKNALGEFGNDPFSHIAFAPFSRRLVDQEIVAVARTSLVPDEAWYESKSFKNLHKRGSLDALLYGGCKLSNYSDRHLLLILNRGLNRPQFTNTEVGVLDALLRQIGTLVGTGLASIDQPSASQLSSRRRQVLDELLEGRADKEIAKSMGIAFDTVRAHIKEIYQFFRVESRAELLSRWVGYGCSKPEESSTPDA